MGVMKNILFYMDRCSLTWATRISKRKLDLDKDNRGMVNRIEKVRFFSFVNEDQCSISISSTLHDRKKFL